MSSAGRNRFDFPLQIFKFTGSLVNIVSVAHVRRLIPPNSRNAFERDQEKEQTDRKETRKGQIKRSSVENRNKTFPK